MELHAWPLSVAGHGLFVDALQTRLSRAGVPGFASMMFPLENVRSNLKFSAAQLASTVPSQYQEYDRLRGEVDLRLAISPALVTLAITLPVAPKEIVIAGTSFIALVLWIQAAKTARQADDLLANAAYLDQIKIPAIENVATELEKVENRPATAGAWIAEIIMTLDRLGMYDESESLVAEASFLDDEDDQKDVLEALPEDSYQRAQLAVAAQRYAESKTDGAMPE
jgi:hypothetical protein